MTRQEYYDLLVKTSAEGGFPGADGISPKYLAECGRRCAIGILIPVEKFNETMKENLLAYSRRSSGEGEWIKEYFPEGMTPYELTTAQGIHDYHTTGFGKWNHQSFVRDLNLLECFQSVNRVEVETPKVETVP